AAPIAVERSTSLPLTQGLAGGSLRSKPATDWLSPFLTTLRPAPVRSTSRSSASVPQNGLTTFSNRRAPAPSPVPSPVLERARRTPPARGGQESMGWAARQLASGRNGMIFALPAAVAGV